MLTQSKEISSIEIDNRGIGPQPLGDHQNYKEISGAYISSCSLFEQERSQL